MAADRAFWHTRAMAIGIDFGTTNSALAWVDEHGASQVARFTLAGEAIKTYRSILYYPLECEWVRGVPQAWSGPRAIEEYLDNDGEGRLMQSMKTFLASRHREAAPTSSATTTSSNT